MGLLAWQYNFIPMRWGAVVRIRVDAQLLVSYVTFGSLSLPIPFLVHRYAWYPISDPKPLLRLFSLFFSGPNLEFGDLLGCSGQYFGSVLERAMLICFSGPLLVFWGPIWSKIPKGTPRALAACYLPQLAHQPQASSSRIRKHQKACRLVWSPRDGSTATFRQQRNHNASSIRLR